MKPIRLLIPMMLLILSNVQAQVSVNININPPPPWGPTVYSDVRYYYLPDLEVYYDVQLRMFIYNAGTYWVYRPYLPDRYRGYDLHHGNKILIKDYRGNAPYVYFKEHKIKYGKGYNGVPQRNSGGNVHPRPKQPQMHPYDRRDIHDKGRDAHRGSPNMKNYPGKGGNKR